MSAYLFRPEKMAKDDKKDGWKEFFWNPRTSEFCGRTAGSWGKWV